MDRSARETGSGPEVEPRPTQASEWCPAPYGRACAGCSRAKSKCFYRPDGTECERCQRLGRPCEPAVAARKRRAPEPLVEPPRTSRLEEKLDDLVSLLRSQAAEKHAQPTGQTGKSLSDRSNGPSTSTMVPSTISISSTSPRNPDIMLDTTANTIHLLAPAQSPADDQPVPSPSPSPILQDVSAHMISDHVADEQLAVFRRAFIALFPFVHIPTTTRAPELRREKPFLWLVIMALTTRFAAQQFEMEGTIWRIVSQRIVVQHTASLDLLLGLVCFSAWSHYFKKDTPFMTMLTQLAVSLALDLDLHNDTTAQMKRREKFLRYPARSIGRDPGRTMEDRRTILAVFHLTSVTWTAYRKTEPLRWTSYMDECVRVLSQGTETEMDILLTTQVKCHIITNLLTCSALDERQNREGSPQPSAALFTVMLGQLKDIQSTLPAQLRTHMQFYLYNTEITLRESTLRAPKARDATGLSRYQQLQNLEGILSTVERWLEPFYAIPLEDLVGISVDFFTQMTHCFVVLFKLATLDEPGWDVEDVKRRADVFRVLDYTCDAIQRLPPALGLVDADGPRSGLFFKTGALFWAIKCLFLEQMATKMPSETSRPAESTVELEADPGFARMAAAPDDILLSVADEPWLTDIFFPP